MDFRAATTVHRHILIIIRMGTIGTRTFTTTLTPGIDIHIILLPQAIGTLLGIGHTTATSTIILTPPVIDRLRG